MDDGLAARAAADDGLAARPVGETTGDLEVDLLTEAPAVGPLLAKGFATGIGRGTAHGQLPERRIVLPDVEQDVRRLADFCAVTGGVLADTLPTTWVHVLTFPLQVRLMASGDFPFPMMGMVHVANEMTQHRPIRVRETLTLSSWADNVAPHRKGRTVDLVGEARVGDEVVWSGRSTYLVRGATGDDGASGSADGATPAPQQGSGPPDPAPVTTEPPAVGEPQRQLSVWRLPADLGRSYARVAGDVNPIHLSAPTAKALGFPRAIAHGMWTHARALAAVDARLPGALTVSADFRKPVLLPSTVVLRGGMQPAGGELSVTDREGAKVHLSMQVSALS